MIKKHNAKLLLYDCRILIGLAFLFITATLQASDVCDKKTPKEKTDPSLLTLERIYTDEDFESKSFGPARWPSNHRHTLHSLFSGGGFRPPIGLYASQLLSERSPSLS